MTQQPCQMYSFSTSPMSTRRQCWRFSIKTPCAPTSSPTPSLIVQSISTWIAEKIALDQSPGCRIRAVVVDGELSGWCGIQPDDQGHELAIVLSQPAWGQGRSIFKQLLTWAKELGHKEVLFHLLETRPEYRALQKNRLQNRTNPPPKPNLHHLPHPHRLSTFQPRRLGFSLTHRRKRPLEVPTPIAFLSADSFLAGYRL